MKNYGHLKHPLIFFTLLGVAISWVYFFYIEGVLGMAGTSYLSAIAGYSTELVGENNWPHILTGIVWMVIFSIAVCGFFVNLMEWWRYPGIDTKVSFDPMKILDPEDAKEIMEWLKKGDFDIKDMKRFVGDVS